eukprot:scpid97658/ scgid13729/ 
MSAGTECDHDSLGVLRSTMLCTYRYVFWWWWWYCCGGAAYAACAGVDAAGAGAGAVTECWSFCCLCWWTSRLNPILVAAMTLPPVLVVVVCELPVPAASHSTCAQYLLLPPSCDHCHGDHDHNNVQVITQLLHSSRFQPKSNQFFLQTRNHSNHLYCNIIRNYFVAVATSISQAAV